MELGNMIFGNSRGQFELPRQKGFEDELIRLFATIAPSENSFERSYGADFENETFLTFPYYWGDCTCGYEENEAEWCDSHSHAEGCYQTIVKREIDAYDKSIGYSSPESLFDPNHFKVDEQPLEMDGVAMGTSMMIMPKNGKDSQRLYQLHEKNRNRVYKKWCKHFGLTYPGGCAVHCTCDYQTGWHAWSEANSHTAECLLTRPNFLYKPTGFEIQWYKYPLRDAYSSQQVTLPEFIKIIDDCIASCAVYAS